MAIAKSGNFVKVPGDTMTGKLTIDTTTATTNLDIIVGAGLSGGSNLVSIANNSSDTGTKSLLSLSNNDNSADGTTGISILQTAVQRLMFLDQNRDAGVIVIDSEANTATIIDITAPQITTGTGFSIDASLITTGKLMNITSSSTDTNTRTLVNIVNSSSNSSGATPLLIQQTSTQRAVFIDQNGNGIALSIDSEATGADVIDIDTPTTSTGNIFDVNADSLTTGKIMDLTSNSSDTGTRTLVQITNDNTLATGTTVLNIQQDAAQTAVLITQNAAALALSVEGAATFNESANDVDFRIEGVGEPNLVFVDASTNKVGFGTATPSQRVEILIADTENMSGIKITQNDTTNNPASILVEHTTTGNGIFLDINADATAIQITNESTTKPTIELLQILATTANIIDITADSLTTGSILDLTSNSTSTGTRNLVNVVNDNTLATGTTVLNIQQDAAQTAVLITQNAAALALSVEGAATFNEAGNDVDFRVEGANITHTLFVSAGDDRVGIGASTPIGKLEVENTSSENFACLVVDQNNTTSDPTGLQVDNESTGNAIQVSQNGNGQSIAITSIATTVDTINVISNSTTTGNIFDVDANGLTTGKIQDLISNSASTSTRTLIQVTNDNTLATGATVLSLQQDAAQRSLFIDQNGNATAIQIDSEAGSARVLDIAAQNTSDFPIIFVNEAAQTSGILFHVIQENASTTAVLAEFRNDGTGTCFFVNQDGNGRSIEVDSESTSANVVEIQAQSTGGDVFKVENNGVQTGGVVMAIIQQNASSSAALTFFQQDGDAILLNLIQNGAGRPINIDNNATNSEAINIDQDTNDAADKYAIVIVSDNAGAGLGGGIDLSSMSLDEPNFSFVSDTITSVGTVSRQIAVDIGGTIFYLVAYTHGT